MSSAKYLILVKHSLPEIIKDIPAHAWHLSKAGQARAYMLVQKLIPYQPDVIISSVEPKARETAIVFAERLGLEFQEVADLHEHDRRGSPYYTQDDFQNLVREFFARPSELVFGRETANAALLRFQRAVEAVLISSADKNVVIVAHGTVISMFVSWATHLDGYALWKQLGLPAFVVLDLKSLSWITTENLP